MQFDPTAQDRLRSYVARIERLEDEKRGLGADIKDVYAEAKSAGFDPKTMREVIRLRRMKAEERQEREALRDTYLAALGMLADTPLGQAAVARDVPGDERVETTVSLNGGPEVPLETLAAAVKLVKGRRRGRGKMAAAGDDAGASA
ncbi:MAG: DUF2312 domain-containing protein [Rhodospirillaceae bacterium]